MSSMAPQPVRRQSSAPSSNDDQDTAPSDHQHQDETLEDSQTVLVDHPSSSFTTEQPHMPSQEKQSPQPSPSPSPAEEEEEDLKKCWICFSDESEDTPETSPWRDPCPCALVAHEDCLLDWIADMESPSSRKRTLGPPKLACPQCKSEITLSRPRSPVVELVRAMERASAKMVAPAAIAVVLNSVIDACIAHGVYTINVVFGPGDARRILSPLWRGGLIPRTPVQRVADFMVHWRLRFGLPLIAPLLILSRTSLADSVLPVLPVIFFATQGDGGDQNLGITGLTWPPSASMTVATLPYLRSAYNYYYNRVWAEREKKWIRDIQPRSGQQADQQPNAAAAQDFDQVAGDQGENNFEIRIDGNIWEDWGNVAEEEEGGGVVAPALNEPPLPDNNHQQRPAQQQERPAQPQERLLSFSTTSLAESILGALLFPTIASLSGDALKYLLPAAWTTLPFRSIFGGNQGSTGLLQHKWGRSIVGGCLFVVVKDAVMLYVKWKMSRQHKERRVVDFNRKAKRSAA